MMRLPVMSAGLILFMVGCSLDINPAGIGDEKKIFIPPNHHLHNFGIHLHSHINHDHALAMGYRMITKAKPADPRYAGLGVIKLSNNHNCPLRIHGDKNTGEVFVSYHQHQESRSPGLNSYALQMGLERSIRQLYPLSEVDLELIRRMALAKADISDLSLDTADMEYFEEHFNTSWPLESEEMLSFNLSMNWQNRRVVETALRAWREDFPWEKYEAIFFDSLQGGYEAMPSANAGYWGGELYPSRLAGNTAFLQGVFAMARDKTVTGREQRPCFFTNIYHARRNPDVHRVFLEWYGRDILRFDHYYLEAGEKYGQLAANGVVPGTREPAYVIPGEPDAWAPASLFAVDDVYEWSRLKTREPEFDHTAFFKQHVDAAVIALLQGSWFGWYGEDYVAQKDRDGRFIYPPALLLLRALPNYENMANVPVSDFGEGGRAGEARSWNAEEGVYQSVNARISKDAIYSRNPINGEWYVVFLSSEGFFLPPEGKRPEQAVLCDRWFTKTEGSVELRYVPGKGWQPAEVWAIGKAIRLTIH